MWFVAGLSGSKNVAGIIQIWNRIARKMRPLRHDFSFFFFFLHLWTVAIRFTIRFIQFDFYRFRNVWKINKYLSFVWTSQFKSNGRESKNLKTKSTINERYIYSQISPFYEMKPPFVQVLTIIDRTGNETRFSKNAFYHQSIIYNSR